MSAFPSIVRHLALCAVVFVAIPAANAQVTIHLVTTQQTSCDVTTDAQGLTLVPGGTDLRATGVTLTGTGCGNVPSPPTPANFALTAPTSAFVGTPFAVSWTVVGATSCSGTANNGGAVSLPGWTDSASAISPRSVTAATAGTYTLSLVCSNAFGSVTSQSVPVVVSTAGGGDNCLNPAARLATANIQYPNTGFGIRNGVDLTSFNNIWGHASTTDVLVPWPGVQRAQPAIMGWGKTQYVAAKFHVPIGTPTTWIGNTGYSTYFSGPELTLAISPTCGDFTPPNPLVCVSSHVSGQSFTQWAIASPTANGCPLTPGTDYFINMKMTDPQPADCSGANTCELATFNVHTP